MATEFERIERLRSLFQTASANVSFGIGDDAAVLTPSAFPRVWTADSAVAEVHFSRSLMGLEDIGYRAFMAAASDVAAMGASCVAALSALVLPAAMGEADFDELARGIALAAKECDCPIIGGNLTRGGELSLTTTVLGECRGPILMRHGAQLGDGVFVTGALGGPALGLLALQTKHTAPELASAVQRFVRPRARLDLAPRLARCARACVDISDGLVQDLMHLCTASGVAAELAFDALPQLAGLQRGAEILRTPLSALLLAGGEEYELLFTAPLEAVEPGLGTCIGRIVAGPPRITVTDQRGHPMELPAGFDHFR